MAPICVTIARRRHGKLFEEMEQAHRAGARMMEIRLDYLGKEPKFQEILRRRRCPLIATVRRREDGGQWAGTEERRLQFLRGAIAAGFDFVDIEDDVADQVPRFGQTRRIISRHEMLGMPDDLEGLWGAMKGKDADVVKIAARANDPADNFDMFRMIRKADVPTIGICMGDLGTASRVLGACYGSPFTYASFNPLRLVAPGILTFEALRELYNFEALGPESKIFGVIGNPISQSLSPLVHNTCYRELGLDMVYVPFRVPAECLDGFLAELEEGRIGGLSVTIPHKEAVIKFGRTEDSLVRETGSANTLVRGPGGGYVLHNTDGPAALEAILAALAAKHPDKPALADRTVLVLGAGGVARTIVAVLRREHAIVTITNRTAERAHDLARDAGCSYIDWANRHTRHFDLLINCTKVGMYPEIEASPFHAGSLQEGMIVFDTVYNPETTTLLHDAQERGCTTVSGVEMFVRQAEAQFRLFAGCDPPAGLMAELVREELSPARSMLREARKAGKTGT